MDVHEQRYVSLYSFIICFYTVGEYVKFKTINLSIVKQTQLLPSSSKIPAFTLKGTDI